MNKTFGMFFYLRKAKQLSSGEVPIYLRITIDKGRVEIATKRSILPAKWNATGQKMVGNSEEVRSFNQYLKTIEQSVYNNYRSLLEKGQEVTAAVLKENLLGKTARAYFLIKIFQEHNERVAALVGKDYAEGTLERYKTSLKHTIDFLQWKYKASDINIKSIDHDFISSYDFYLRSVRNCGNNTAVKYLKNFKKIILICIHSGWLEKDPFVNYKARVKEVHREFLTKEELEIILQKDFENERLNQIKDVFIFSCLTGLAYVDIQRLKLEQVVTGFDGDKWIYTHRKKTDTQSRIPILPLALDIIQKYKDCPEHLDKQYVLPVPSNQKVNAYLKEIADLCRLKKVLTFHMARHTFATTVTLGNGVSIESVSKMLGHKSIRMTQHYAKIMDDKLSSDMNKLKSTFLIGKPCFSKPK